MTDTEDIYELFRKVKDHPDFLFGTIFTKDDLNGRDPDKPEEPFLSMDDGTDRMAEAGNDFLDYYLGFPPEDE